MRAGADQLWIELGINRLADAGTAANDALAASITAMRTSSLSTSTTHGLGELIAVVRECADAAATAAVNSTPESINAAIKARLRDRRSSLAMTKRAFRISIALTTPVPRPMMLWPPRSPH